MESGQEPWCSGAYDNAERLQGLKAVGEAAPPSSSHVNGDDRRPVFGSWDPRELSLLFESTLSRSVLTDYALQKRTAPDGVEGAELWQANARGADVHSYRREDDDWAEMSYHEWITRRRPCKLPPGLPRPPRQPDLAPPSPPLLACDDDDLDSEWDEWYSRNVASGAFTDWWDAERLSLDDGGSQPCSCRAASSTGECVLRCDAADGDAASSSENEGSTALRSTPLAVAAPAAVKCSLPGLLLSVLHDTQGAEPAAATGPAAVSGAACAVITDGSGAEAEEGSVPLSPTGSDCRTASDDSSRDTSRSCSLLSLQSWDVQGAGSDEMDSELEPEHWEGSLGAVGCGLCGTDHQPSASDGDGCVGKGCKGAGLQDDEPFSFSVLPLIDCTLWEHEVEAQATMGPVDCRAGRLPPHAPSAPEWVCPEWFQVQLPHMLRAVVSAAFFDVGGL